MHRKFDYILTGSLSCLSLFYLMPFRKSNAENCLLQEMFITIQIEIWCYSAMQLLNYDYFAYYLFIIQLE